MARERMELQQLLVETLGSSNVYFQTPASLVMKYPCIRYKRDLIEHEFANNKAYMDKKKYSLTLIYTDPDSDLPDKFANLPMCKHDSFYVSDNLNHDIFTIYY